MLALDEGPFKDRVKDLTGGLGADVVFDPIGGRVTLESLRCLNQGARILTIGYASGQIPDVPANHFLLKNAALAGFNLGTYLGWGAPDARAAHAGRVAQMMADLMALYEAGELHPFVSHRYTLDTFQAAMENLLDRQVTGKSVIEFGPDDR